ncbi:MAG TPA: HRDC domain-containing protein [Dehalococcoidia bacterium]|nr:HRDC domain-containing protein [Dehalococcoidia bacterium]
MNQSAVIELVFVNTPQILAEAVEAIRGSPVIGFDTEFVGETTYEPQLCLIQIATQEGIFVIDPLVGLDLSEFWEAMTAPGREVVALAARQELLFCLRYAGRLPGIVFDPQVTAGLVGYAYPLSHTNLVQRVLNARIDGGEAYTDWRQRPLARRQVEYAADDVRYLLALRASLIAKAEALGRVDWLRSECQRLAERVVESEREERWSRISGASSLGRRDLAVLREVWRWRDNTARAADIPPRRILGDDLMVAIAKRSPKSVGDLLALRGMDRAALRKAGPDIAAAVQVGLKLPDAELPETLRRDDPPQVALLAQLASILSNSLALENQVHAALLATSSDLQDFVRWRLGLTEDATSPLLEGWRGEILGRPLMELLEGRMAVRVADMRSASPLRIEPIAD